MKKDFVSSWKSSVQPRKQRKYGYNAPLHTLGSFISTNLSKDLRKQYGKRSLRVRKGDTVKVMRGTFKGKIGKVERVSVKKTRIFIMGIDHQRKDGSKNLIPIQPSNVQITGVELTDKRRFGEAK